MTLAVGRGGAKAQQRVASSQMVYSRVVLGHLQAFYCPESMHIPGEWGEKQHLNTYYTLGQGSQSGVCESVTSASPENLLETKLSGLAPDLLC